MRRLIARLLEVLSHALDLGALLLGRRRRRFELLGQTGRLRASVATLPRDARRHRPALLRGVLRVQRRAEDPRGPPSRRKPRRGRRPIPPWPPPRRRRRLSPPRTRLAPRSRAPRSPPPQRAPRAGLERPTIAASAAVSISAVSCAIRASAASARASPLPPQPRRRRRRHSPPRRSPRVLSRDEAPPPRKTSDV